MEKPVIPLIVKLSNEIRLETPRGVMACRIGSISLWNVISPDSAATKAEGMARREKRGMKVILDGDCIGLSSKYSRLR